MYNQTAHSESDQVSKMNTNSNSNKKLLACDSNYDDSNSLIDNAKYDVERISSNVQAQIEQLFADVAKDSTSRFAITCLGSLPLKNKVASLKDLQEPLRELYLHNEIHKKEQPAFLDICENSLSLTFHGNCNTIDTIEDEPYKHITQFHNIAVWSAVKFFYSKQNAVGAFLPLISTETINKSDLFQPLSTIEQQLWSDKEHSPIFAIVMRSIQQPKVLECHAFLCKNTEDAIIIAATLYQSLMFYVNSSHPPKTKRHIPRNENGINCMSISGSSVAAGIRPLLPTSAVSSTILPAVNTDIRKTETTMKKSSSITLTNSSHKCIIHNTQSLCGDNPKLKHYTKHHSLNDLTSNAFNTVTRKKLTNHHNNKENNILSQHNCHRHRTRTRSSSTQSRNSTICNTKKHQLISIKDDPCLNKTVSGNHCVNICENTGDILTRVAIPRSGSFLNTGGLSRYKSLATRRYGNQCDIVSGGGGSPIGFNELFNEFRTHENLHSLDEILSAIIDANGMSFNDLKPIYKEFLLKLSVTLTKDELFQRSKHIMRRQRKKNSKSKIKSNTNCTMSTNTNTNNNTNTSMIINSNSQQIKTKTSIFGKKSLKKVFQFSKLRTLQRLHPKFIDHKPPMQQSKVSEPITSCNQHQRHLATNSGSDISLIRHDNALSILNRNSSSGYVSCSECNVDSEGCSCKYPYRCYCSLRKHQHNYQHRHKNSRRICSKRSNNKQVVPSNPILTNSIHRHSMISCNSEDKCYCSLPKDRDNINKYRNSNDNDVPKRLASDTTFCDTDSCKSSSKCYCKDVEEDCSELLTKNNNIEQQLDEEFNSTSTSMKTINYDKIALEYELFNVTTNNRTVQPEEALSVKKSMEAAALFGDFKLSQTTDIKGIKAENTLHTNNINHDIMDSLTMPAIQNCNNMQQQDDEEKSNLPIHSLSSNSSRESCYVAALNGKYPKGKANATHVISTYNDKHYIQHIVLKDDLQNDYQSMRTIRTSLEDTLGYLP